MKGSLSTAKAGILYGFVHFSVEVCSFFFLFSRLQFTDFGGIYAFLFDALAFIPQCFLGLWADRVQREHLGVLGCILMVLALLLPLDTIAFLMLTAGNAMVHIAGAKHTLNGEEGKITPCSIFVAGGSFGVITGQLLGGMGQGLLWIPLVCMILALGACLYVSLCHRLQNKACSFQVSSETLSLGFVVLFAFLSAAVRAYVAYAIPTGWKKETIHAVFLFCSMGIGKYLGGVLCDRIGYQKTATLSLLISLPFLLFGNHVMVVSLIGVGLFSMTMPVTVAILSSAFPKDPAFAFGITTVALFVGTAPAFFIRPQGLLVNQIIVLILGFLAAVSLKLSLKRRC